MGKETRDVATFHNFIIRKINNSINENCIYYYFGLYIIKNIINNFLNGYFLNKLLLKKINKNTKKKLRYTITNSFNI